MKNELVYTGRRICKMLRDTQEAYLHHHCCLLLVVQGVLDS